MSSDGYFEDDSFDQAALDQIAAIEAAALASSSKPPPTREPSRVESDDEYDVSWNANEADLENIYKIMDGVEVGNVPPQPEPRRPFSRAPSSRATRQTNLFGEVIPDDPVPSKPKSQQLQRARSSSNNPFGQQAQKTKKWDHTAFAKSGTRKSKGKGKQFSQEDYEGDEEEVEFEQFPAPFVSVG
ncbi:hypothetical protein HGRIS_007640 [Hohenbuehelia grisea]|uniref:Uncharacterized protein n=1 Tax=Hohenbuehelia grisea TaxID=104357 RepID=A0ABR3J5F9_9AGAR